MSQSNSLAKNTLRIIGGQWRGRRLPIAALEGLRPTPDHLRETLFNWLMFSLSGSRCLDAFAGSGALGIEALSREAKEVTFLEKAPVAVKTLQQNMKQLKCSQGTIVNTDTLQWLQTTPALPFDIIFLDPPFHQGLLPPVCKLLQQGWVRPGTFIYIEAEKELALRLPENWQVHKTKRAGQLMSTLCIVQ